MAHHRYINAAGLGLVLIALVAPTAAARATDEPVDFASKTAQADCSTPVRSLSPEDAAARQWRCAGVASTSSLAGMTSGVDLRSPDAKDAARNTEAGVDLRSPDARDAAGRAGAPQQSAPPVAVPAARFVTPSPAVASSDTDHTTAAIVAGGAAGVLLLGSAWLLASRRRGAAQRDQTLVSH